VNGLSRRFWYLHYKQAADLPEIARLHAEVASAIASNNGDRAAEASNLLIDNIESFTNSTMLLDRVLGGLTAPYKASIQNICTYCSVYFAEQGASDGA
jgi:hypothetical protein